MRAECKLVGKGQNAGVQFRSERIPDHHEVKGYQCDIGVISDQPIWGFLYDESRRRKFLATSESALLFKQVKLGGWNRLTVRCEGPRIQIWVNDKQTVDYREEDAKIPRTGIIGLQIHSGPPTEAWYRRIRIRE